jgi:hypothetical protein
MVTVTGRAVSGEFESYRLEYGQGEAPTSWTVIHESNMPVSDTTVGVWDTRSLTPDTYVLRLVVKDKARGELVTVTTVKVVVVETPTPRPIITRQTTTRSATPTPPWPISTPPPDGH